MQTREILQSANNTRTRIYMYIYTCDSPDSRLNDTPPYASRDYTSQRRMRSLAVEVTGTEERAVKRAAVPELEASSSSSRPNSLLERESNMPVLTRACTTATLPRIKRFKFASFGELTYSVCIYISLYFIFFFFPFNLDNYLSIFRPPKFYNFVYFAIK